MNDPTTITIDLDAIAARVEAALDEHYTLVWAAYDDQFSEEQLAEMFTEGTDPESFMDWYSDAARDAAQEVIHALVPDPHEWVEFHHSEQIDELRITIEERDNSEVFDQLLRNTGSVLLRYAVTEDEEFDLEPDSWRWDEAEVNAAARKLGDLLPGVDFTFLPELRELVQNATYGGTLYVLWYGDVDEVVKASFDDATPRTITWTDPSVVCLDRYNGSGHDVQLKGLTLTLPWSRERITPDSQGFGYGWDQVCGLNKGAYRNEITLAEVPA